MIEEILSPAVDRYILSELKTNQVFNYHYYFMKNEKYLKCYINEDGVVRLLKLGVDYAVKSTSGQGSVFGEVRYIGNHIQSSVMFVIERSVPIDQRELFSGYGDIGLTAGAAIDKVVINIQDSLLNNDPKKISIHIGEAEVAAAETANLELPQRRENTILGFNKENNVVCEKRYSAGDGIKISQNNVISAKALPSRTDYIAGDNVQITRASLNTEIVLENAGGKFVRTDLLPVSDNGKFFICLKNEEAKNSKITVFNNNAGGTQFDIVEATADVDTEHFHILPQSFLAASADGYNVYYAFRFWKEEDEPRLEVYSSLNLLHWEQCLRAALSASDYWLDIIHTSFGYFKNLPLALLTYDESIFFVQSFKDGEHGHFYLDPSYDTILAGGVAIRNNDFVIIANKKDNDEQKIRVYSAIEAPHTDFIAYDFPIRVKNVMSYNNEYIFFTDHALYKVNDFTRLDFTIPLFEFDFVINDVSYQDGKIFVCCEQGKIYKSDDLSNWTLYNIGTKNIISCCYSSDILNNVFLLASDSEGVIHRVSGDSYTISATDTTYELVTQVSDGLMSSNDKRTVDKLSTVAITGSYNDLTNRPTAEEGIELTNEDWPKLRLKHASAENLGGIKIGMNLTIEDDGTMHAESGIQDLVAGDNIIIDNVGGIQDGIKGAFASVTYGFGMYVAVGTGIIAKSFDGKDWITYKIKDLFPQLADDSQIQCVVAGREGFAAVTYNPSIALTISPDFKTCDHYDISGAVNFVNTMCYAPGGEGTSHLYVIGGNQGRLTATSDFRSFMSGGSIPEKYNLQNCCCTNDKSGHRIAIFACGSGSVIKVVLSGNGIFSTDIKEIMPWGSVTTVSDTPTGMYVTTSSGEIYNSDDYGETWKYIAQPSTQFLSAFGCNDTDYYAAGTEGLFTSYDGKHWRQVALNDKYSMYILNVTNNLIVAAGTKNDYWQDPSMFLITLADTRISAIDTTYEVATQSSDGLMSSNDKIKIDKLSTVAITGSYNDLRDKLLAGNGVHIDANNIISSVSPTGEYIYTAGEHISIEQTPLIVKKTSYEKCVDILYDNERVYVIISREDSSVPDGINIALIAAGGTQWEEHADIPREFKVNTSNGILPSCVKLKDGFFILTSDLKIVGTIDKKNWSELKQLPASAYPYIAAYGIYQQTEYVFYFTSGYEGQENPYTRLFVKRGSDVFTEKIIVGFYINEIIISNSYIIGICGDQLLKINPDFSYIEIKYPEEAMKPTHAVFASWDKAALFINESVYTYSLSSGTFDRVITSDKISPVRLFNYKGIISFVSMADNKLYTVNDVSAWNHSAEPIGDIKYHIGVYLEKVSYLVEYSTMALYAFQGINNTISAIYENATAEADGLMSKEDKIKLNAAMKFPDGEAGYTLPDAAGRADKLITFDSNGNIDLHSTHDYDKWRNVRISTTEPTVGLNLELPNPTERANKVIGFNADGKSIEMKTAGGTDITVGQGLQKNGNEISLKGTAHGKLGGIYQSYHPQNDLLIIESDGQAYAPLPNASANTLGGIKVGSGLSINNGGVLSTTGGGESGEFINIPVITGDIVSERIAFVDRGKQDVMPSCVASFVINGKKTFFIAEGNHIYRSNDCISWHKTEKINNAYQIVSFLQSGENILFAARLDESPNSGGEIFLSSDGGYSFTKKPVSPQSFYGWHEIQGYILICSYHGLYNSLNGGDTWNIVPNSVNDIFSSPVFFKGKFYFFRKTRESDKYSTIVSMTTLDYTFVTEYTFIDNHIPLSLTVDDNSIYVVVKDGAGYPQSFIYRSYDGSNFTLMQTYNNQYTKLLGKPNKWLLIDYNKQAWFTKDFTDKPTSVYSTSFGLATEYHYSKNTDLFMIHDMKLFVSTTAYHIGV